MVAFGAWAMTLSKAELAMGGGPVTHWWQEHIPLRMQVQHAAIFAVHKKLELFYNKTIPLYLQDRNYVESDRKALQLLKNAGIISKSICIVNGDFGFQQGFVEINEATFFYDSSVLHDGFYRQIFEYTRPLAILALVWYMPEPESDWKKAIGSYTFKNHWTWEESPKDLHYPGLGM
jgi:hypothetical protein